MRPLIGQTKGAWHRDIRCFQCPRRIAHGHNSSLDGSNDYRAGANRGTDSY